MFDQPVDRLRRVLASATVDIGSRDRQGFFDAFQAFRGGRSAR